MTLYSYRTALNILYLCGKNVIRYLGMCEKNVDFGINLVFVIKKFKYGFDSYYVKLLLNKYLILFIIN